MHTTEIKKKFGLEDLSDPEVRYYFDHLAVPGAKTNVFLNLAPQLVNTVAQRIRKVIQGFRTECVTRMMRGNVEEGSAEGIKQKANALRTMFALRDVPEELLLSYVRKYPDAVKWIIVNGHAPHMRFFLQSSMRLHEIELATQHASARHQ